MIKYPPYTTAHLSVERGLIENDQHAFLGLLVGGNGVGQSLLVALSYDGREHRIAVDRLQFPVLLGYEVFYFLLSFYNQGQSRNLSNVFRQGG